jgi:hypothetical protein
MTAGSPDVRAVARRSVLVALIVCAVSAMAPSPAARATDQPTTLTISRVDVSTAPEMGAVVHVPGVERLRPADLAVAVDGSAVPVTRVSPLSEHDIQLAYLPDPERSGPAREAADAEAAQFIVRLAPGAETTVVVGDRAEVAAPPTMSEDPAAALRRLAGDRPRDPLGLEQRLAVALATLAPGSRVRRTIVMAADRDLELTEERAATLRARLLASGTALYVLAAGEAPQPTLASLAAASGGLHTTARDQRALRSALALVAEALTDGYYLRFRSTAPRPAALTIGLAGRPDARAQTVLPERNPVAPRWVAPDLPPPADPTHPLQWAAMLLVAFSLIYTVSMLVLSRRRAPAAVIPAQRRNATTQRADDLLFVFLLPCLNEEKVIAASVQRLLAIPSDNVLVMVIDDASDDRTAAVVEELHDSRVRVLRGRSRMPARGRARPSTPRLRSSPRSRCPWAATTA